MVCAAAHIGHAAGALCPPACPAFPSLDPLIPPPFPPFPLPGPLQSTWRASSTCRTWMWARAPSPTWPPVRARCPAPCCWPAPSRPTSTEHCPAAGLDRLDEHLPLMLLLRLANNVTARSRQCRSWMPLLTTPCSACRAPKLLCRLQMSHQKRGEKGSGRCSAQPSGVGVAWMRTRWGGGWEVRSRAVRGRGVSQTRAGRRT